MQWNKLSDLLPPENVLVIISIGGSHYLGKLDNHGFIRLDNFTTNGITTAPIYWMLIPKI